MQYIVYRIHRYKQNRRIVVCNDKGHAKHTINQLKKAEPTAVFEIRLSQ